MLPNKEDTTKQDATVGRVTFCVNLLMLQSQPTCERSGRAERLSLVRIQAAMGLAVALGYGYLTQAFANISWMFQFWRSEGPRPVPQVTLATHNGPRLAYAVPVLAGLMVTLWLK